MASLMEIMQLCRLCLVKDQVNIPIFEEQGDIRQIFLKISACLPVKVSREDNLPKKICDGCSYKLEILYQFWNTSANSEKQLLKWLSQVGAEKSPTSDKVAVAPVQPHSMPSDGVILKQEVVDLADSHSADEIAPDDLNVSSDAQDYILQQQQLPYQPIAFQFPQDGFAEGEGATNASGPSATVTSEAAEAAPPKRKRRAAAMKALPPQIDSEEEDEDDVDMVETKIAKTEEQTDESGGEDPEPTAFVGVPSTSTDNEQPGPSGVGKGSAEAPLIDVQEKFLLITGAEVIVVPQISVIGYATPATANNNRLTKKPRDSFNCSVITHKTHLKDSSIQPFFQKFRQPKKMHSCKVCHKSFATSTKLNNHALTHSDERPFSCSLCGKSFKTLIQVKRHMTVHLNRTLAKESATSETSIVVVPKPTVAQVNQNNGDTDLQATGAVVENTENKELKPFQCEVCFKSFTCAHNLKNHKLMHVDENKELLLKIHFCPVCNKCFPMKNKLLLHMAVHSEERPHKCNVCAKSFKTIHLLRGHVSTHVTIGEFNCKVCARAFKTKRLLSSHETIHLNVKAFVCDVCGRQFKSKLILNRHIKCTHYTHYLCKECGKEFQSQSTYVRHQRRHKKGVGVEDKNSDGLDSHHPTTSDRKWVCSVCQQVFEYSDQLEKHSQCYHPSASDSKWVCDVCGKNISTKQSLQKHKQLVHEGVRCHKCQMCGKAFTRKIQLQIHMRIHTGEKPYACEICNKTFTQKTTLVVHMRLHTGERPYVCKHCQKGFVSGSLMNRHQRRKHKSL